MPHKSFLPEPLQDYVLGHWLREADVLRRLREETAAHPKAGFQIPPDQGQLMGLLVRALGVRRALEVGVFTGYSSLVVAMAMGPEGRLTALDISEEFTSIARRYWTEAGVSDRIDLRIAPALESLEALQAEVGEGVYDLAFIDADKGNYGEYFERCLRLVRVNGLILIDNVLWDGKLTDPEVQDEDTNAIRHLNDRLSGDPRVEVALIPIGDGVTLVRKRDPSDRVSA
jgi:predicted O-methyltransferase YrrM